jgi:hypothetical protein
MALMVFLSPFFRWPGAWLWGEVGGWLYRVLAVRTDRRLSES